MAITWITGANFKRIEDQSVPETERGMNLNTGATRSRTRTNRIITYERPCTDNSTMDGETPYNPDSLTITGSYPWTCKDSFISRAYGRRGSVYREIWEKKGTWGAWS